MPSFCVHGVSESGLHSLKKRIREIALSWPKTFCTHMFTVCEIGHSIKPHFPLQPQIISCSMSVVGGAMQGMCKYYSNRGGGCLIMLTYMHSAA